MARVRSRSDKTTRGRASGTFMKPMRPDAALAEIIGSEPLPRTEVTKKIWEYIRKHKLQDPHDRRTIRADAKLRPIFGGKVSVSMFELTKLVHARLHGEPTTDVPPRPKGRLNGEPTTDVPPRTKKR